MSDKAKRLQELLSDIKSLTDADDLTGDQLKDLEAKMHESRQIQTQMKAAVEAGDIEAWGSASAGMLQLGDPSKNGKTADEVQLEAIKGAGEAIVETKAGTGRKVHMDVIDLEPLMDAKSWKAIHDPSYNKAFKAFIYNRGLIDQLDSADRKVLNEGQDSAGGYLLPEEYLNAIIQKEPTPLSVTSRVRQLNTMRDSLVIPRVNYTTDDLYTTGIRATWTGEQPASATTARVTEPVFGQTRIAVYTAMMSMPITNDMLEDSAFPVLNWSSGKFAETIDLLRENMVLNGSGVNQPRGILVNPGAVGEPAVIESGQAASLTPDSLESVAFALPPQYDNGAAFVFNKLSTAKAIAQMKDGQGRYMWGAGLQDSGMVPGWKDRKLWGYDVLYSEFMPNIGASTYPAIFGDLSGYYLLNRIGFSVQVLRELYAETNQILLLGRVRFGGQVAEDWKLKTLQCHV